MKRIFLYLIIIFAFAFPSNVLADVAPPYYPPGYNPQPGVENTQVRMQAETVLIDVQNDITPDSLGNAHVTADFKMRNLGSADENMAVRFPISAGNGRGEYPEISDLEIKVNGQKVLYNRVNYPDIQYSGEDIPWAEFDVNFPAGEDTDIQVSYSLRGTGYPPYTAFYYILQTGAGWKDTIGSADITLRLPYEASPQNVILDYEIGWATTLPGASFQGNEARWHFENFEPGPDGPVQNMEFALVSPSAWWAVLTERENTAKKPGDGEAWGRLARAYKRVFMMGKGYRTDAGGAELYQLSIDAYEKCLAIKPEDAQWHAGFADLLANRSYWDAWSLGPTSDTYRAFAEIRTALELAPNDPKVQEIAASISMMFPEGMSQTATGYDFPWLTQTPTPIPPTPTTVAFFDPAEISGIYKNPDMLFSNEKKGSLTVTLDPDHSAELERQYENEPPVVSTGSWMDNGDGTIKLNVIDPNQKTIEIVFEVGNDQIEAVEYPGLFGNSGVNLEKVVTTTPQPPLVSTPRLTATQESVSPTQSSSSPSSRSSSPICGSAAFVPLAMIVWGIANKARRKPHQ